MNGWGWSAGGFIVGAVIGCGLGVVAFSWWFSVRLEDWIGTLCRKCVEVKP